MSWIQKHRNLLNRKSLCRRQYDEVAMPVGADRDVLHYFAPVRLYAVQILDANTEQRATQPIVNSRDKRLFIRPLLESRHHVGLTGDDRGDESRDVLGQELEVGRIEDEHRAAGVMETGPQSIGDAAPGPVPDDAKEWILRAKRLEHSPRVVDGPVVDDDYFVAKRTPAKRAGRQLHE